MCKSLSWGRDDAERLYNFVQSWRISDHKFMVTGYWRVPQTQMGASRFSRDYCSRPSKKGLFRFQDLFAELSSTFSSTERDKLINPWNNISIFSQLSLADKMNTCKGCLLLENHSMLIWETLLPNGVLMYF